MKRVLLAAAILIGVVLVGERVLSPPRSTAEPRPGNPAVYAEIARETDCDRLQEMFDIAAANHDRELAAGRLEQAEWAVGYMAAADARMRAVGCY